MSSRGRSAPRADPGARRWPGLRFKFAVTYVLLIAGVLLLLNTYPVLFSQELIFTSKQDALQSQLSLLSSGLSGLEEVDPAGAGQVMEQLSLHGLTQVIITDAAGTVVYDTDQSAGSIGSRCDWPELAQALNGDRDVFHSAFRSGAFQSRAAAPVTAAGRVMGGVCLFEYDADQGGLLLDIQRNLGTISVVVCALAVAVSLLLSKAITRRIDQLLQAVRLVREGEYSHRLKVSGHDELRQLADEFNQLTGRLQTTEESRRRFVSDASHELKTPLASIRLLADSILHSDNMDLQTAREFIEDIGRESERLSRITEKLLTLTRMDSLPEEGLDLGPTAMAPVVRKAAHMLEPLAAQSEVTLSCALADGCLAPCGEDDLYQIVFNLMENAVKYNLPGGSVEVTLDSAGAGTVLKVEDTGVGVPEEDLARIFDRFYRVDKARSRAAGGTGLGLSIVRDAVRLHGGTVECRRRPEGQGTCFVVTFPPPGPPDPAPEPGP